VYGVSVDGPFAQQAFIEDNDLNFPLLSDFDKEVIEAYDVVLESLVGIYGPVSERAVFVIDNDGNVAYRWVGDDPSVLPDSTRFAPPPKKPLEIRTAWEDKDISNTSIFSPYF